MMVMMLEISSQRGFEKYEHFDFRWFPIQSPEEPLN